MFTRIFTVNTDLNGIESILPNRIFTNHKAYSLVESFIPTKGDKIEFIHLLSKALVANPGDKPTQKWTKAVYEYIPASNSFVLIGEEKAIDSDEYYSLLLSLPNQEIEQKMRLTFVREDFSYTLDISNDKNFSVLQISSDKNINFTAKEELFKGLSFVQDSTEYFISLEELFCRFYLPDSFVG